MAKMTEKEKQDWDKLYQYIKNDILHYEKEKNLPKSLILRLKGLSEGKFMANNNTKARGKYSFEVILLTFKLAKFEILSGIRDKDKFKDERHLINYMFVIVESKINDVFDMMKRKKECTERVVEVNIQEVSNQSYKRKTENKNNDLLDDLW